MPPAQEQTLQQAADPQNPGLRAQLKFLEPYWKSDQKWRARLQLGSILALTVAEIALTAGVGLGFQAALNALVSKQAMTFAVDGALTLGGILTSAIAGNGREYLTSNLGQNWRGWLTRQFSEAWLRDKAYLRLQHSKKYAQNPDQRIAETISNVTGTTLGLTLGLFKAGVGIATFSLMLWHISPLMVGAAAVCAVGSHAATHWAGGPLRKIWRGLMDTEAKFRHALIRVRDNAKPIALAGLEPVEKETLTEAFNKLDATKRDFYKANWRTGIVGWLNMSSVSVVPIALTAPKFLAGTATVGGLELARQIYTQFYFALSWFPQSYAQIASWTANVNQLMEFQKDLQENKGDITQPVKPQAAAAPKNTPAATPKPHPLRRLKPAMPWG